MKFIRDKSAPIPDYHSDTHRIWKSSGGFWKIHRIGSTETVDAERANMREAKSYCARDLAGDNWSEKWVGPVATDETIARRVASAFLNDNIEEMGREFDNLWENGRGDDIAKEFGRLYDASQELQTACLYGQNRRFFCPAMLGNGAGAKAEGRVGSSKM